MRLSSAFCVDWSQGSRVVVIGERIGRVLVASGEISRRSRNPRRWPMVLSKEAGGRLDFRAFTLVGALV
jgi:hypothetical protein